LVRNTVADTALASTLDSAAAWQVIDPPAKIGNATVIAFGSDLYYLATDTGQIWHGSPEASWEQVCNCGAAVRAMAPDRLNLNRIVVTFNLGASPGRIREFIRQPNGAWTATNIDATFNPDLQVAQLTGVGIHPSDSNTVFVGSDQGVFDGTLVNGNWVWTRSPGVPNVGVSDIEVNPVSGAAYAATYGRGVFTLGSVSGVRQDSRASVSLSAPSPTPLLANQVAVAVQAIATGEDGAPPSLPIEIRSKPQAPAPGTTPYEIVVSSGSAVAFTAPASVQLGNEIYSFTGWHANEESIQKPTITINPTASTVATAYYRLTTRLPDPNVGSLELALAATSERICEPGFSHSVTAAFEVKGGQSPIDAALELTKPNGHTETLGARPRSGSRTFPLDSPRGRSVQIRLIAQDARGQVAHKFVKASLKPCQH
jgi:hypothetical protein